MNWKKILFLSVMTLVAIVPYVSAVPIQNFNPFVVTHYDFEQSSGLFLDDSGNGNDATNNGAAYQQDGIIDFGAYCLKSESDYIDAGNIFTNLGKMSANVWVKRPIHGEADAFWGLQTTGGRQIGQGVYNNDTAFSDFRDDSGVNQARAGTTINVSDNDWHMLTYSADASLGCVYLWVDGELQDKKCDAAFDGWNSTAPIYICDYSKNGAGNEGQYNTMYVDEFTLWNNTILDNQSVNELYNNGEALPYSGGFTFEPSLYISARDFYDGVVIENFTASFNNGSVFSTTTGNITLVNWTDGNYTITVTADGYIENITTFEHINVTSLFVDLLPNNNLELRFLDETTQEIIYNVTYSIFSDNYVLQGNSSNTNFTNLSGLPDGFYTIQYTKQGFTSRNYYISIPLQEETFINNSLYLLNESSATTFVLRVTDQNNQPIENTVVYLQRGYIQGSSYNYEIVEMMQPSFILGGTVPFTAVANVVPYAFTVVKEGETVFSGVASTSEETDTFFLVDTELFIRVNVGSTGFQSFQNIQGLTFNLQYLNATNTFRSTYNDQNNNLQRACLNVRYALNLSLYAQDCSVDLSDILLVTVDNTTNDSYVANFVVTENDGTSYILASKSVDFNIYEASGIFGIFGVLLTILTLVTVVVALASNPVLMVVAASLVLVAAGTMLLGLIVIPIVLQGTIVIISLILAYMIRGKN